MTGRRRGLALLTLLYAAQGMPFGFQALALPLFLADAGVSLATVGLAQLLAVPWMVKALWAPLVERAGRRRPWLLAMQAALLVLLALGAASPPGDALGRLAVIVLLMNLVTATQDIAVDGLAVDLLRPGDLGLGNAAQVGGYKVGMMLAGGLVVALAGHVSWAAGFAVMGAVAVAAASAVLAWREPPLPARVAQARGSLRGIVGALAEVVRSPGQLGVLLVVSTYKLGESLSDGMWKQYVVRRAGHATTDVALWLNVYGMLPSIAGSLAGGWLASRLVPARAIAVAAVARTVAVIGFAAIAAGAVTDWPALVAASWLEDACGGALTTAMFAYMMAAVDARVGATHYTLLASVEVLGKAPGGVLSGVVAQQLGFAACFGLAAALSVAYLPLLALARVRPSPTAPATARGTGGG